MELTEEKQETCGKNLGEEKHWKQDKQPTYLLSLNEEQKYTIKRYYPAKIYEDIMSAFTNPTIYIYRRRQVTYVSRKTSTNMPHICDKIVNFWVIFFGALRGFQFLNKNWYNKSDYQADPAWSAHTFRSNALHKDRSHKLSKVGLNFFILASSGSSPNFTIFSEA